MELSVNALKDQIPYYLTSSDKAALVHELKNLSERTQFYTSEYSNELLQGDGWSKLQAFDFVSGERDSILGIILSNTCDVAGENKRDVPVQILFSPVIFLSQYIKLLKSSGVDDARINQKVDAIKKQHVTNIFYLPQSEKLKEETIALLGLAHTMPLKVFDEEVQKQKIFTLNQTGFYLFILKLSIHFCRFQENVARH